MELTGLGGGVMLAVAAALWLVYLVPSWLKRREYLATERNAVRLQQTIRVLAETTEAPTQALRRAPAGPVAVGRPVQPMPRPHPQVLAAQRLRRTRMLATLVLAASLLVVLIQSSLMITAGPAAGSWLMLGGAALASLFTFALLGRLAEVARNRRSPQVARSAQQLVDHQFVEQQTVRAEWTPVPMPKPLYMSRAEAAPVAVTTSDLAESLRRAAAEAEEALRTTEQPPAVQPAAQAPRPTSPFASMGIVDVADTTTPDLDAALARRRVG
jgi:hypothetical protein